MAVYTGFRIDKRDTAIDSVVEQLKEWGYSVSPTNIHNGMPRKHDVGFAVDGLDVSIIDEAYEGKEHRFVVVVATSKYVKGVRDLKTSRKLYDRLKRKFYNRERWKK